MANSNNVRLRFTEDHFSSGGFVELNSTDEARALYTLDGKVSLNSHLSFEDQTDIDSGRGWIGNGRVRIDCGLQEATVLRWSLNAAVEDICEEGGGWHKRVLWDRDIPFNGNLCRIILRIGILLKDDQYRFEQPGPALISILSGECNMPDIDAMTPLQTGQSWWQEYGDFIYLKNDGGDASYVSFLNIIELDQNITIKNTDHCLCIADQVCDLGF